MSVRPLPRLKRWQLGLAILAVEVGLVYYFRRGIIAWVVYIVGGGQLTLWDSGSPYHGGWRPPELPQCDSLVYKDFQLEIYHPCLAAGPSDRWWMSVALDHTVYLGPYRRNLSLHQVPFCSSELAHCPISIDIADRSRNRSYSFSTASSYPLEQAYDIEITLLAAPLLGSSSAFEVRVDGVRQTEEDY